MSIVVDQPLRAIATLLKSRGFWVLLLAMTAITQLIAESRLADGLRGAGLDTALSFGEASPALADIVIVEIDDVSFRRLFAGKLPLDRHVLAKLLQTVRAGRPALTVLDLELMEPLGLDPLPHRDAPASPVVWSAGTRRDSQGVSNLAAFAATSFGVPYLLQSRDGVYRRYSSTTWIDGRQHPTLIGAAVSQACALQPQRWRSCKNSRRPESALIRFAPKPEAIAHVPAWRVLEMAATPAWQAGSTVRNKIVVVGGTYQESRDSHPTPLRMQAGAYIMAQAMATELDAAGLREPGALILIVAKLAAGVLLAMLAATLSSRWSVYLHLLIVPTAAFATAAIAVTVDYWIDFVPVLMSGFIHQWHHDVSASQPVPRAH